MKTSRFTVYDSVTPSHFFMVCLRYLRGSRNLVVRPFPVPRRVHRFRVRLERWGLVERLRLREWPYRAYNPAMDLALEKTEQVYDAEWAGHPVIRAIAQLYDDARVHLAFKKALSEALRLHYEHRLWCEAIGKELEGRFRWRYAPREPEHALPVITQAYRTKDWMCLTWDSRLLARLKRTKERLLWWLGPCYLVLASAAVGLGRRRFSEAPRSVDYCVAVVSPEREFANNFRGPDFLLDGVRIRPSNSLVVPLVPLSSDHLANVIRRDLCCETSLGNECWEDLTRAFRAAQEVLRHGWDAPLWVCRAATGLIS